MGPLSERDREMLEFAAEHRFVLSAQLAALTGIAELAARRPVRALVDAGQLSSGEYPHGQPPAHQITRAGLRAIGSGLPAPRPVDLSLYRHDVGLGWLMLIARRGRFGPISALVSERRMRSEDARSHERDDRHGVRLGGEGPGGRDRLHYPDMVLVTPAGCRIAFELELSTKSPSHRERILSAYLIDPRIDDVVYLVDRRSTGAAIARSARRCGAEQIVHVQNVSFGASGPAGGGERGRVRAPTRSGRTAREPAAGRGR
jgi:hypothetical protein